MLRLAHTLLSRRPRLAFSLAGLFLFMTIVCCFLGMVVNRAARQKRAVERLRAGGADVFYDWQTDNRGNKYDAPYELIAPRGRLNLYQDMAHSVTCVRLPADISDDELKLLNDLPGLRSLDASYCFAITDAGIKSIGRLKTLNTLRLYRNVNTGRFAEEQERSKTELTDDALRFLAESTSIDTLLLWDVDFSDQGLRYLKKLKPLKEMAIFGPNISHSDREEFRLARPDCHVLLYPAAKPNAKY